MPSTGRRFLFVAVCLVCAVLFLLGTNHVGNDTLVMHGILNEKRPAFDSSTSKMPAAAYAVSPLTQQLLQQTWFEDPSPIDLPNIRAQCERTDWNKDVYIQCGGLNAGLTTIISGLRVCFKMALDAGANIVVPAMALRDSDKLDQFNTFDEDHIFPYSEWFDEEHLISSLRSQCPQMKIARLDSNKKPELPSGPWVHLELESAPDFKLFYGWSWPGRPWQRWFWSNGLPDALAEYKTNLEAANLPIPKGPTTVALFVPFLFFRVTEDTTGHEQKVWHELNQLVRFNKPSRDVVAKLLSNIDNRPYIGVHYRGEKDNIWSSPEVQLKRDLEMAEAAWGLYLSDLPPNRLKWGREQRKTIYLACGDQGAIKEFKEAADKRGWSVIDKWSIANELDTTEMDASKTRSKKLVIGHDSNVSSQENRRSLVQAIDSLPFDHQGSIDLALMTLSTFFIGFTGSAFSFTAANARDPLGRYRGSTLERLWDEGALAARSHMFNDGESGQYPCCF